MRSTYIIKDIIKKNISDSFDILIYNPEFLTINLENAQLYLCEKFDNKDISNNKLDLLDGLMYDILFAGKIVYQNIVKSENNLFTISNIPFGMNIFHKGVFIIYNLPNILVKKIQNYSLVFEYKLSTENFFFNNLLGGYEIDWNSGINETHIGINKFRFLSGMCGVSHHSSNDCTYISNAYYDSNHKIFAHDENFEFNNNIILHLDNLDSSNNWINGYLSECNVYCLNKILMIMLEKKTPIKNKNFEAVSDSIKIPIWLGDIFKQNQQNFYKYTYYDYSKPDAISNIELLCVNTKYIVKNIKLTHSYTKNIIKTNDNNFINNGNNKLNRDDYEDIYYTFDLEFDETPNGYKILGLSNFHVIPLLQSCVTKIEIEFVTGDEYNLNNFYNSDNLYSPNQIDFWLKYDRYILDTKPRIKIGNIFCDYEEYPIIDLAEFFTKNDKFYFNLELNPV